MKLFTFKECIIMSCSTLGVILLMGGIIFIDSPDRSLVRKRSLGAYIVNR